MNVNVTLVNAEMIVSQNTTGERKTTGKLCIVTLNGQLL